jgi:hypothetical protein
MLRQAGTAETDVVVCEVRGVVEVVAVSGADEPLIVVPRAAAHNADHPIDQAILT